MKTIDNAWLAFLSLLRRIAVIVINTCRLIYAHHALGYHRDSALNARNNIEEERRAVAYHDGEAMRIELSLIAGQLSACRQRTERLEDRQRELIGDCQP